MRTEIFDTNTREQWLQLRASDITSTEVAGLFGLGRSTPFEIWQRKKNNITVEFEMTERMEAGLILESAISTWVGKKNGWKIENLSEKYFYVRAPELRLGASYDNFAHSTTEGVGVVEVKNVDYIQFKNEWNEEADTFPDSYELQLQLQLLLMDLQWGCVAALVGGNNLKVFMRKRDDEVCAAIVKKVKEFWESIHAGVAPPPDYLRDYGIINLIYDKRDKSKVIEVPTLEVALKRYKEISAQETSLEAEKNEIKARILSESQEAGKIFAGQMAATISKVEATPAKIITADMVGTSVGGRSGYNRITITERK